ncbi:hypothetical protein EGY05_11115 [Chryseobacterium arthrosphaerae]|uniref:Uridine phosphorylase n=1 Tax=Chryseobacterium arthrosphaerae TaxID=651561 RepID=A0A1B8ZRL7_9FLAO|nr:nucleoside phosphorylase [Chryseobacterium arthrosphaerae]AYZ12439.1 hypothetical protein EGY05_11115 [Chryseobacterium arthrosphaerae]OCA74228.1 hypothetical protein BBI00_07695 [Chryseobacterium arthrosphaerae]
MAVPVFPKKYLQKVALTPKDHFSADIDSFLQHKPIHSVIFCYEEYLMEFIKANYKNESGRFWTADIHILQGEFQGIAVVGNFGIGGPASTHLLEILISQGIKNHIMIGHAGCLQKDLPIGSMILCEKAVRDEGLSYHYLPDEMFAYASTSMTAAIDRTLNSIKATYKTGSSWTIDSMYRETADEIAYYSKLGIDTVEMEAASMFAVGQFRNVSVGAIFVVSDIVAFEEWDAHINSVDTQTALKDAFTVSARTLKNLQTE